MTVLALLTDCFGGYGGIAQYNRDFVTALSHHPRLDLLEILPRIAPQPIGAVPSRTRQLRAVRRPLPYSLKALLRTIQLRPRLVFCGHLYHAPLAGLLKRLFRPKVVVQLHGTEVWKPLSPALLEALLRADCILCVSEDTRARLLAQCPMPADKVHVVHNTIRPQFTLGDRASARRQFGPADAFVMLSVSRLAVGGYKGQDRVIRAMPGLVADGLDLRYLIAGGGPDQERLEQVARDTGVADRVQFLGNVPDEDLPVLYRASDLFVLPSTGEGFGIVYAEAMASGTPALGIDIGGVRDAIGGDALGFITDLENFEPCLKTAIDRSRHLADDARQALSERTLARLGRAAFERALFAAMEPYL